MSKLATALLLANIYPVSDIRVYDGDTFTATIVLANDPSISVRRSIRVSGIDTPELGHRAKCEEERVLAERAKQIAAEWLSTREVFVTQLKRGKFAGRSVGVVRDSEGELLADALINADVARVYSGRGRRAGWCDE